MNNNCFRLWHQDADRTEWREESLPDNISPLEVSILTRYSLISNGTERLVASGKVPGDAWSKMQVPGMLGSFALPIHYGYSLVGEVEGPSSRPLSGQLMHVLRPHSSRVIVDTIDCFQIPASVPALRAVLASNMETAVNAIWDSRMELGARVLVIGAGLIGLLVARLVHTQPGTQVFLSETDRGRADFARELGFTRVSEDDQSDFDVAFHTSGTSAGLQDAIDRTRPEGRIVELSWYGDRPVTIQLGGSFHYGRKQIISSQVSRIPEYLAGHWNYKRRKELVFRLLEDDWYDQLLTPLRPDEVPDHFRRLRFENTVPVAPVIDYHQL